MKLKFASMIAIALISLWSNQAAVSAHPPTGIVVDRAGNVFFSDLETVWKFSAQGKLTVFRAGQRGRHVHELAIDSADNIYGADISYNPSTKGWISTVWKITPDGSLAYLLESTEHPPRGMSIWLDRNGNMYSVEQNNHTKTQTLLLRRTPTGDVTTLAGGAYGNADGKGAAARFGSIGGIAFGPDGSLFLTDSATLRKVTLEGEVTTIVNNLDYREPKDQPRFLSDSSGALTGIAVAADGTIYVADSANRRLFRITKEGIPEVILRTEPPFFPNGVATNGSDVYVLEIGFTLPNISSGPRVRKISADGKQTILTTLGADREERGVLIAKAGVVAENALVLVSGDGRWRYSIVLLSVGVLSVAIIFWQLKRRARA